MISLVSCSLLLNNSDEKENTDDTNTNLPESNDNNSVDELYKTIVCRSVEEYTEYRFSFNDSDYFITLPFPNDWYVSEAESSYDIYYGVNKIGSINADIDLTEDNWKSVVSQEGGNHPLFSTSFIEYNYDDSNTQIYRHRFVYNFTENSSNRQISICINYNEADSLTVFKMREGARLTGKTYYTRYNDLKELRDSKILMLGNSFIASSQIGTILNELFSINNKSCTVYAVSNGYATISKYVDNQEIMEDISAGIYDAIFICGLYSEADLFNLKILIDVCNEANIKLVVFPAHNEKNFLIEDLIWRYPDIYCLNWKNELEMIISSGVRKQDLCINDSYSHSNPTAGFVGANMIYRAIYGESPNFEAIKAVNPSEINNILNEYFKSEYILDRIYYFD